MDPVAHTLAGSTLAAAGLRRVTPLATAALIIGANVPDVDVLAYLAGADAALAHRRGWTHGVLAMVLWPLLVAAALLAFDSAVRGRRDSSAPRARAGPLILVAAIGVATHPLLDWLNNYGLRWLMPFDGTWYYGDALFIIDPWMWLLLGGASFLAFSRTSVGLVLWLLFFALTSWLMATQSSVPLPARIIWFAGIAGILLARAGGLTWQRRPQAVQRIACGAVAVMTAYIAVASLANLPAREQILADLAALDMTPVHDVMVGPVPGNPLAGSVIAVVDDAYHFGAWRWWTQPRFTLSAEPPIARDLRGPVYEAAAQTRTGQRFLAWSRYPYMLAQAVDDGYVVTFRDARYRGTESGLADGVAIRLNHDLAPLAN